MYSTESKVVMRKIPQDSDEAFSLRYSLVCDHTPEGTVYGVRVEKLCPPGIGSKDPIEFETAHGLTPSAEQAAELVALLAENTVTPCVLLEILDELIPFTSEQKHQPNNQYFKQAYVAE